MSFNLNDGELYFQIFKVNNIPHVEFQVWET